MSEVDPDPDLAAGDQDRTTLGGRDEPSSGDPTEGGRHGEIGAAPSIAEDEPSDGTRYPVGGGRVAEESDASPVAEPGPDA